MKFKDTEIIGRESRQLMRRRETRTYCDVFEKRMTSVIEIFVPDSGSSNVEPAAANNNADSRL